MISCIYIYICISNDTHGMISIVLIQRKKDINSFDYLINLDKLKIIFGFENVLEKW